MADAVVFAAGPSTLQRESSARPANHRDNYIDGVVVGIELPTFIIVRDRWRIGEPPVRLRVTPSTEVCRGVCGKSLRVVQVGDRVESDARRLADGTYAALWIDLNLAGFYGEVTRVGLRHLEVTRQSTGRSYTIHVLPTTLVRTPAGEVYGSTRHCHVDDYVSVGGSAPDGRVPPSEILASFVLAS